MLRAYVITFFIVCYGCGQKTIHQNISSNNLGKFCEMLSGQFSSETQSLKDTSYFHIALAIYPIWPERSDARYFYVEQAMAPKFLSKPYRQRIYKIVPGFGDTIISKIYTFKDPLTYAGAHQNAEILKKLSFDKLEYKDGCDVYLSPFQNGYKGGTKSTNCSSNLRGASYATTEVILTPNYLLSWDRGYDKDHQYVWGAQKGGYHFDKLKNY